MEVYHGSLVVVDKPEIRISDRFLDFGYGFYTTTSMIQAGHWGEKLRIRNSVDKSIVTRYSFDYNKAKEVLTVIEFNGASEKWLQFVCDNRSGRCKAKYDIVIGPVADDNVYQVVKLYEMKAYDKEEALKRLKVEALFDQILFHTEKTLQYLTYKSFKVNSNG